MARGLRAGDGGAHLITFHPTGGQGSADVVPRRDWLDFNMRQNGHGAEFTGRYDQTRVDYDRTPIKPVLDGEPIYEDHPVVVQRASSSATRSPPTCGGRSTGTCSAARSATPTAITRSGRCGRPDGSPINNPLLPWTEAIDQPGAAQMQHARALLESRPFLTRIPDDRRHRRRTAFRRACPAPAAIASSPRATRTAATRWSTRRSAGRSRVRMSAITGPTVKAWWFNPRTGAATAIGTFANTGERTFTPPDAGEMLDWVLVLDDASKAYGPPGQRLR